MATGLTTLGKYYLFTNGFEATIETAKLYTASNVLVNSQTANFVYNASTLKIEADADIVFPVAGGTNDVSYVQLVFDSVNEPLYRYDFASTYSFLTNGTLTLDSFDLSLSGASVNAVIGNASSTIFKYGWATNSGTPLLLKQAILYNSTGSSINTQNCTFTANATTGALGLTGDIVFTVGAGATNVNRIDLIHEDGVGDKVVYRRTLASTYNFPTAGTLTVDNWVISV